MSGAAAPRQDAQALWAFDTLRSGFSPMFVSGKHECWPAPHGLKSQEILSGQSGKWHVRRSPWEALKERAMPGESGSDAHGRILVVDDEPAIADSVATVLAYEGFEVDVSHGGRDALTKATQGGFDLIVLDGFEVTKRMRNDRVDVPVLFLTAKSDVEDRVAGLRLGGDDYVAKPFALLEIVARAKAILRRRGPDADVDGYLRFAGLEMDEDSHLVWRNGTLVTLTATEFNVLRLFLLNPKRVLSKDQIINHVWNYEFGGNYNVVETYIGYLRRKLDKLGPPLIYTVQRVGYVLREQA
jgi:two-component system, OmpR family, response regulator